MDAVDTTELGACEYVLLTTFRRDGRAVPTAVWVAPDGDGLVIWTVTDSGKVKRLRRNPAVLIGPCDLRGRPTGGQVPGTGVILDAGGTGRVRDLLRRKYGLKARITLLFSRLRRGAAGTVGIRVTLTAP